MSRRIHLMIAGAQKAGTSSLKAYLEGHPKLRFHAEPEFPFFVDAALAHELERALAGAFDGGTRLAAAKSAGLMACPAAVERLRRHNPGCRVVVVLRHPVERAYSAFWFARQRGWEPLESFEEALRGDPGRFQSEAHRAQCAYLERGRYATQVESLHAAFTPERVLVLLLEELERDPVRAAQRVFAHAGVDAGFVPDTSARENRARRPRSPGLARLVTRPSPLRGLAHALLGPERIAALRDRVHRWNAEDFTPPPMPGPLRASLLAVFEEDNRRLAELLGRDLWHWTA